MPSMDPRPQPFHAANPLTEQALPHVPPEVKTCAYPLAEGLLLEVAAVLAPFAPDVPLEVTIALWADPKQSPPGLPHPA